MSDNARSNLKNGISNTKAKLINVRDISLSLIESH
jgi:hypothetical protein